MSTTNHNYCGECCWFKHEDTDGWGICYGNESGIGYHIDDEFFPRCEQTACSKYVSNEVQRHYQAVLLQANRYRRDDHVPSIYRMPDPRELGKAIDFAYEFIRIFSKL